ncbi:hypothetical protein Micbo1qcDRAFT_191984 [Microdochium bolleyi]|uniref:RNase MRP protein 1 RNA binding domain-containing protein n=1 Tax=Microdochium bolleyi TaxID=196109 RepID=A0A136JK81_9PEZI|nr:hypothetical protein Micbo1qcDRAFT_191984 [Microdochium bolleyi]
MATENRYQQALDALAPLEPLLAGFARRNKNQHRRARWWASFGMLRRDGAKLMVDLVGAAGSKAARAAAAAVVTSTSSSSSVPAATSKGPTSAKPARSRTYEDQHLVDRANQRARWTRDVLVPKCYIQFSQLTADNQFATLGVVLLGALAQVHAACCMIAGPSPAEAAMATEEHGKQSIVEHRAGNPLLTAPAGRNTGGGASSTIGSSSAATAGQAAEGRKIARPAGDDDKSAFGQPTSRAGGGGGVISHEDAARGGVAAASTSKTRPTTSAPATDAQRAKHSDDTESSSSSSEQWHGKTTTDTRQENKEKLLKRKREKVAAEAVLPGKASREEESSATKSKGFSEGEAGSTPRTTDSEGRAKKKIKKMDVKDSFQVEEEQQQEKPRTKVKKKDLKDCEAGSVGNEDPSKKDKQKKKKKKAGGGRDEFDSLFSSLF